MAQKIIKDSSAVGSVLVVGGGLAGMYAAIAADEKGVPVTILSKGKVGASGNSMVAMSVHRFAPAAPGLREDYRKRFFASGAGEQDAETAEFFVEHAAQAMERLKAYRFPLGYRCLEENGEEYPYLACCQPKQGAILTRAVRDYIDGHTSVRIQEGVTVCDIVRKGNRAVGVIAERKGSLYYYPCECVILATGGAGNIYAATSNTNDTTGDGYAMALRCGLPLVGMEFVQFYPYRIYSPGRADIFPDLFEHGAVFRNEKGERFMDTPDYPMKELENRDVVARAMYWQKEVRLDLSACEMDYLQRECPNIAEMYLKNPGRPLLLRPVAHFNMGGVPLRRDCSTDTGGLFVCGEVSGGLHGANRLAGSALTETVVFGRIAGENASRMVGNGIEEPLPDSYGLSYPDMGNDDLHPLVSRLRGLMWDKASVVRTGDSLREALSGLEDIRREFETVRPRNLKSWIQLRDLLLTSEQVVQAALARDRSLGAHYRADSR